MTRFALEIKNKKREICEQSNLVAHNQTAIAALDNLQV